jgi:aldose 1-epimerase
VTVAAPPPSGRQVSLKRADATAVVVEVGGGLRTYEVGGRPVLDGYGTGERCSGGRGQPLLPWPNRLADGRYRFDGVDHQADISEPATGSAIHGLTRWRSWTCTDAGEDHATMGLRLRPSPAYPWDLNIRITYRLDDDGLSVRLAAVNESTEPCPFAAGFHPYLWAAGGLVDELTVTVPAARRLVTDDRGIPTGSEPVEGTAFDLRAGTPIGDRRLDTGYTDLARGGDGRARVRVDGGDGRVELWVDEAWTHLMVFTGDTLSEDRRRRGLAVEPMTAAPDAFNNGEGLVVLEPGEHFEGTWGITPG